jgi:hypothetical protein
VAEFALDTAAVRLGALTAGVSASCLWFDASSTDDDLNVAFYGTRRRLANRALQLRKYAK